MIPAELAYARARDVNHALELLGEPDAKVLAGGQSLLSVLKLRISRPALVVDVSRLPLREVRAGGDEVRIGALTTWSELESAPELRGPALAAVHECAHGIGDLQVRNLGTIGGSLVHADPASDMAAVLLALGARVELRSREAERTIRVEDFLVGPFLAALDPTELVLEIVVPVPGPGSGSAYSSVEHPASGFPLAGAAALVDGDGSERVAITGVSDRPFLVEGALDEALERADVFGDRFASGAYRRHLAAVVARRALDAARARAGAR